MANTRVRSVRNAIAVGGTDQYEIITTCIEEGDLPDKSIFLLNIADVNDPKSDTLNRVIGISDVSTYGNLLRLMHEGRIEFNMWEKAFYELALKLSGAVQAKRWTGFAISAMRKEKTI